MVFRGLNRLFNLLRCVRKRSVDGKSNTSQKCFCLLLLIDRHLPVVAKVIEMLTAPGC